MSGRGLSGNFALAMKQSHVDSFLLVDMYFDSQPLYVCSLAFAFTWNGNTYLPTMGLGTVQQIIETDSEVQGLTFTLSGVPESSLAIVLNENVQGRRVVVAQATLGPNNEALIDPLVWEGELDTLSLDDQGPTATITVTAEHKLAAWAEPNLSRFSDQDQQALYPGDRFFEYAAQMVEATIVWPSKQFFRK